MRRRKSHKAKFPKPDVSLVLVPKGDVEDVWPLVEEYINVGTSILTADDWKERCASGDVYLWMAWSDRCEAAAITNLFNGTCIIAVLGGKGMRHWLGLRPSLEAWAKSKGCSAVKIFGREGWGKMLPDYHKAGIILEKKL